MIKKKYNKKNGYGFYAIQNIPKDTIIITDPIAFTKNINKEYKSSFDIMFDIVQTILFYSNDKLKNKFLNLTPHTIDKYIISGNELLNEINISSYKLLLNVPIDELRLICSKYIRNAFTFTKEIQATILLTGSIFNHSCIPNVSFYPNNKSMIFITNKDINIGEELFISYLNTNKDKNNKLRLLHQYGFNCNCKLCG